MLEVVCKDMEFILLILTKLVKYMHYIIPILLIVLIVFDLLKVLTGNADDKAKSEAFSKAVKRMIYAVLVFLVPTILMIVFRKVEQVTSPRDKYGSPTSWIGCWNSYYDK